MNVKETREIICVTCKRIGIVREQGKQWQKAKIFVRKLEKWGATRERPRGDLSRLVANSYDNLRSLSLLKPQTGLVINICSQKNGLGGQIHKAKATEKMANHQKARTKPFSVEEKCNFGRFSASDFFSFAFMKAKK